MVCETYDFDLLGIGSGPPSKRQNSANASPSLNEGEFWTASA